MKNTKKPLWAPWRLEYILEEKDNKCFLCNKEEHSDSESDFLVVYRGKYSFVILNAYPYSSGHLMVAPYLHIGDISELDKKILHEIMDLCVESKNVLTKLMSPDAFNIGFNLGSAAGAGLEEHLHLHIVPRWSGDTNFMPVISDTRIIPQSLQETAEEIKKLF